MDSLVRGSTQESQLASRYIARDKLVDRLADEQICVLNVVPEVLPDLLLRRAFDVNKIAADLDVRAVDDRQVRPDLLDQRN